MPNPAGPLPANVLAALEQGNTMDAIRLLRTASGLGLKEAKEAIDQHLAGRPVSMTFRASTGPLPVEVQQAMRQGHKIEAIKRLREQTGLGLKEAKDAVERFGSPAQAAASGRSPGEMSRSGKFSWLAIVVVAALVGYWLSRSHG